MLRTSNREWTSWGLALSFALALIGCAAKNNDSGGSTQGGVQAAAPPVAGMGSGGATAPAPAVGSGGSGTSSGGPPASSGSGGQPAAAGSGGTQAPSPDGGMMGAGDGTDASMMMSPDAGGVTTGGHGELGKGDGSDVVTIGDSWMQIVTNGGGIEGAMDRMGTTYRHYSVPGTLLLNGQIPSQYDQAKAQNPDIKTVIMTGGGNDIMFSNGCATKESCTMAVQGIVDGLNQLWTTMDSDGVKDVIYIAYSKNAGTAPADTRPDMVPNPMICVTGQTITCHQVDTTDLVGPTDTVDGIHPTQPACDAIAKRVLDMMESEGVRR